LAATAGEPDFKSAREPDYKTPGPQAITDEPGTGTPMTLAEALVQSAFDAAGHQGLGAIQAAVDAALFGDPGGLNAGDPRGLNGVGVAGNSNYANEPQLPGGGGGGNTGDHKDRPHPVPPSPPVSP
jgi:hypothetical protein